MRRDILFWLLWVSAVAIGIFSALAIEAHRKPPAKDSSPFKSTGLEVYLGPANEGLYVQAPDGKWYLIDKMTKITP